MPDRIQPYHQWLVFGATPAGGHRPRHWPDAPIAPIRRNVRTRTCRPTALVDGKVGLALPIRLASTDDSLSYGARGNHGRIVREKVAQRYGFDLDLD